MPQLTNIRTTSVAKRQLIDAVAESLVRFIQEHCESGDRLPSEAKLGEMLGVSKGSLREASRGLEMMGVVEKRNGAGTYVTTRWHELLSRPLSWGLLDRDKTMTELVEARILVEMPMVEMTVDRITDEELLEMEVHVNAMENTRVNNAEKFMQADLKFHLVLAAGTKNRVLADYMNIARSILRQDQLSLLGIHTREQLRITAAVHREILENLKMRDRDGVKQAMARHSEYLQFYLIDQAKGKPPTEPDTRYFKTKSPAVNKTYLRDIG